jgi:SH3-like domain-containing protein
MHAGSQQDHTHACSCWTLPLETCRHARVCFDGLRVRIEAVVTPSQAGAVRSHFACAVAITRLYALSRLRACRWRQCADAASVSATANTSCSPSSRYVGLLLVLRSCYDRAVNVMQARKAGRTVGALFTAQVELSNYECTGHWSGSRSTKLDTWILVTLQEAQTRCSTTTLLKRFMPASCACDHQKWRASVMHG